MAAKNPKLELQGIKVKKNGFLSLSKDLRREIIANGDIKDDYIVNEEEFESGHYSNVCEIVNKKTGEKLAGKFLKQDNGKKNFMHELAILKLCQGGQNIVQLKGAYVTETNNVLLLELATNGDLMKYINNHDILPSNEVRYCIREVLKALRFLHQHNIVHLDLKPHNLLIMGERLEDGLKLGDLGLARILTPGRKVCAYVGTGHYMSPETLLENNLSVLADIWTLGVMTYELLSGVSPFAGRTDRHTYYNILGCNLGFFPDRFKYVSTEAIDFIRKTLQINPNDRMTVDDCLQHAWLKEYCNIGKEISLRIANGRAKKRAPAKKSKANRTKKSATVSSALPYINRNNDKENNEHKNIKKSIKTPSTTKKMLRKREWIVPCTDSDSD